MAKCLGADVARVTAWAIVGSMVVAGGWMLASLFETVRHTGFSRQQVSATNRKADQLAVAAGS
jgi:branched-subunit amino acid ABC-type transport system permease component